MQIAAASAVATSAQSPATQPELPDMTYQRTTGHTHPGVATIYLEADPVAVPNPENRDELSFPATLRASDASELERHVTTGLTDAIAMAQRMARHEGPYVQLAVMQATDGTHEIFAVDAYEDRGDWYYRGSAAPFRPDATYRSVELVQEDPQLVALVSGAGDVTNFAKDGRVQKYTR